MHVNSFFFFFLVNVFSFSKTEEKKVHRPRAGPALRVEPLVGVEAGGLVGLRAPEVLLLAVRRAPGAHFAGFEQKVLGQREVEGARPNLTSLPP